MTDATGPIDVRDLKSVRQAALAGPGDDLDGPSTRGRARRIARHRVQRLLALRHSPIARKIVVFNLVAMILLVTGVLYLNPSRDNLVRQRANGLINEVNLVADVLEARMPAAAPVDLVSGDGLDIDRALQTMDLRGGVDVTVYGPTGHRVGQVTGAAAPPSTDHDTAIIDLLTRARTAMRGLVTGKVASGSDPVALTAAQVGDIMRTGPAVRTLHTATGTTFIVATTLAQNGTPVGVVSLSSAAGELDDLVDREREQVLRLFLVSVVVSVALSLALASTIANPLADLAAAAELGRDRNARKMAPTRVRIPDLTARPDEIGRLSGALRGMVRALYERIEGNEQFAADVAHEIKNPLASLRSAVVTMRLAKRQEQRETLLKVIEHDVDRLDRLVTEIAGASRLDAELVKEEEESFDLLKMLNNVSEYLSAGANDKGVDYSADLPSDPLMVQGLEGRLAQVFVNLITNAISFCEDGDAIRVWARRRDNRILVVVEDTGPGIPEGALKKIFTRFYSERPEGQFGNNSGLGLAISKQIVEAHGGVIWAENIRPSKADVTSDPLGARFVVGLPV